jgi:hypothetical protein
LGSKIRYGRGRNRKNPYRDKRWVLIEGLDKRCPKLWRKLGALKMAGNSAYVSNIDFSFNPPKKSPSPEKNLGIY